MKKSSLISIFILASLMIAQAFPPAPPHEIYGMVRGEDGAPITQNSVRMLLETEAGVTVSGAIAPDYKPGINYYITVPMDAAITPDPYLDNALTPLVPFRIKVIDGTTTNLPLEMSGDYALLGQVGESTRIDLTLGVDSDGDGLPDAWEELLISIMGGGLTQADITPDSDTDGDGMSDGDEYIAGTYAFDDQDIFKLYITDTTTNSVVLSFLGIEGRSYRVEGSSNLTTWAAVPFKVPEISDNSRFGFYPASNTGVVEIEVPSTNAATFYRGRVQ
jgi:hypothetical protein